MWKSYAHDDNINTLLLRLKQIFDTCIRFVDFRSESRFRDGQVIDLLSVYFAMIYLTL